MIRDTLTILMLALVVPGLASGADREREARELEAMLIAPCCFRQQVSVHQSEAADEVRRDVRRRLAAGEIRDDIVNAYVQQYGKRILAEPPAEGFDRLLYLLPPFGLVLSAGLAVALIRRFAQQGSSRGVAPVAVTPIVSDDTQGQYGQKLDDELRDLD